MQRTHNFTQTSESLTAHRNRWPEGHLLLAISSDKFVKQVTVDSTTMGFGLVSIPSLELAFCLRFSLDLYNSVSPFSSYGWRTPICSSDKNCSCENQTNKDLMTFRGFLAPTISNWNSFVKLPGPSTVVKHTSFFPHECILFLLFSSSKIAFSLLMFWLTFKASFKFYLLCEDSLFLSSFLSIFNQYPCLWVY